MPLKQKFFLFIFLGFGIFISSFIFPFHSFLPAWSQYDDTIIIMPGEIRSLSVTSALGNPIRVMLVVSEDSYVHFYLMDQNENLILEKDLNSGSHTFEVQSGSILSFENNNSTDQSLYCIIGFYYYKITFQLLGAILSALGIIGFLFNNHKKELEMKPQRKQRRRNKNQ